MAFRAFIGNPYNLENIGMAGFWFGHEIAIKLDELTGISVKKSHSLSNPKGFLLLYRRVKKKVDMEKVDTCLARRPSNVLTATKRPPWEAVCMR